MRDYLKSVGDPDSNKVRGLASILNECSGPGVYKAVVLK